MTLGEACEGVLILGDTGSGKSSGSGRLLLDALLNSGAGGLVLTVKLSDREYVEQRVRRCGRSDDLIVFGPDQPWRFNFLDYELTRPGRGSGQIENVVQLFQIAGELVDQRSGQTAAPRDRFWEQAKQQLIRSAVTVIHLAGRTLTMELLYDLIRSAPQSLEQVHADDWRTSSACYQLLCAVDDIPLNDLPLAERPDWPLTATADERQSQ